MSQWAETHSTNEVAYHLTIHNRNKWVIDQIIQVAVIKTNGNLQTLETRIYWISDLENESVEASSLDLQSLQEMNVENFQPMLNQSSALPMSGACLNALYQMLSSCALLKEELLNRVSHLLNSASERQQTFNIVGADNSTRGSWLIDSNNGVYGIVNIIYDILYYNGSMGYYNWESAFDEVINVFVIVIALIFNCSFSHIMS